MNDSGVVGIDGLRKLGRVYLRRRYAVLFYTLLLTMVVAPIFAAFELKGSLIEFFLAANLLAAVCLSARGSRRSFCSAVLTVTWLARSATVWFDYAALSAMTLGLWT